MAAWRVFQKLAPASESPDLTTTWLVLQGGGRVDFDALDKPLPPEEARSELKAP
jgi:hypothetical protein